MKDSARLWSLVAQFDSNEPKEQVRGQVAESLRSYRTKKTIKALVDCSADASAEVRFWCVFGLGHFVRKRKTPLVVARALEERLGDIESPDDRGNWWPIGLEALAMLRGYKKSCFPIEQIFRETILRVMREPLNHSHRWRWADCYWD